MKHRWEKHPQISPIFAAQILQLKSALIGEICGQNLFLSVFHL
jgi:hypothetical protein